MRPDVELAELLRSGTYEDIPEGISLEGSNLRGLNLRGVDVQNQNLNGSDFRQADLQNANLADSDCDNCDFSGANLSNANLLAAGFKKAKFLYANMRGATLSFAEFYNANLTGADLRGANFEAADLVNANLSQADLQGVIFNETNLSNANLEGANLTGAIKLENAILKGIKYDSKTTWPRGFTPPGEGRMASRNLVASGMPEELKIALSQLTGSSNPLRSLASMVGAKNFMYSDKDENMYVHFNHMLGKSRRLPKSVGKTRLRYDMGRDTYTLTFFTSRGNVLAEVDDIHADELGEVWEEYTGLYLSFNAIRKSAY